MDVLYVTSGIAPYVLGGMQAVSRRHIEGLTAMGVNVSFVHTFRDVPVRPTDLSGREYVIDYPKWRGPGRFWPWHYPEELKEYSQNVDRIARDTSPSVIYSEGPLVTATLKREDRPPVVFHPHGLNMYQDQKSWYWNLRARTLKPLVRFHLRKADCVISQGGMLTEILAQKAGVSEDRVAVVPNAVSVVNDHPRCQPRKPTLRCLFVGRNDPRKGLSLLLNVLRQLPDTELDVVGAEGVAQPGVRWHGVIRDVGRLREFYRNSDVFVLPSYSEGMPTVLLEAMRDGLPAVATDVGASRELVIPGKTGWLIPAGGRKELLATLREVAHLDKTVWQNYSQRCRDHIRNGFSEDTVCRRLYELLQQVCPQNSPQEYS